MITADAAHAQDDTAEYLAGERHSDYFLLVKGNQPGLQRAIYDKVNSDCPGQPDHIELDYSHGRIIKRSLWATDAGDIAFPHAVTSLDVRSRQPRGPGRHRPKASGASNQSTGSATPPGPKMRTLASAGLAPDQVAAIQCRRLSPHSGITLSDEGDPGRTRTPAVRGAIEPCGKGIVSRP